MSTIINTWTHTGLEKHVGLWNKTIYNKQHEQTKLMVEMKVLECDETSEDSIADSQQDDDMPIIAENQGFLRNRIGQFKDGKSKSFFFPAGKLLFNSFLYGSRFFS